MNTTSIKRDSTPPRPRRSLRERKLSAGFARLQLCLDNLDAGGRDRRAGRAIVVVPSRSVDRWHEPPAESQAYEERQLSALLELSDPNVRITYVTSSPIVPAIVDYYLSLLPTRLRRSARHRLTLIALGDRSTRPLTAKLLEHPGVLDRIRATIPTRRASYLVPYGVTTLERDLALATSRSRSKSRSTEPIYATPAGARRAAVASCSLWSACRGPAGSSTSQAPPTRSMPSPTCGNWIPPSRSSS